MPVCDYYFNHERSPCSKKALFICRSGSSIAPWVDGCASYTFTSPPSPSLTKRLRPLSKQNRRGFLRISKGGFVTLFAIFLESKDVSSDQLISKHNGPVLLFKALFKHQHSFLSCVATDSMEGHDMDWKFKDLANFYTLRPPKAPKIIIVSAPW